MSTPPSQPGPHGSIPATEPRCRLVLDLFDALWSTYRERVSHVAAYEQVIRQAGATFVNDHIAFRTFACQQPLTGISTIGRIFEACGYVPAGCYHFPDKHLDAIHYQHPLPDFPRLFISELKVWELERPAREIIARSVCGHRPDISAERLAMLYGWSGSNASSRQQMLDDLVAVFQELPWPLPEKSDVEALNEHSQYAAWVLVHGYNVNHFTSSINSHGVESLADIDKTVAALQQAGVPMKTEIEGAPGTKLRQTATAAAVIDVPVLEKGEPISMPWSYAYFELAERGTVTDPETGEAQRFDGFLGPQATNLFEMTRLAKG